MTYQGDTGDRPGPEAVPQKRIYRDLPLLQLAALVLLLDQFSKFLVREFLAFRDAFPAEGFFRITHTHNTGSAFGIFQDQNAPLILVSIIGIAVLAFIYQSQRNPTKLLRLSLGLQLGGAAGNLLDRLCLLQGDCEGSLLDRVQQGYVTDFIDVGTWPIFNLADSSIVMGLVLLGWLFLRPGGVKGSPTGTGALEPVPGAGRGGNYASCPLCDGDMLTAGRGWHCATCGAKEWVDAGHSLSEPPAAAEQIAAARGLGPIPIVPAEAVQNSTALPAEAAPSGDVATGLAPGMDDAHWDSKRASSPYFRDELGDALGDEPSDSGTSEPL